MPGFEPQLMLEDSAPAPTPVVSPADRVADLEETLRLAEQRAADSEQLYKDGVLSKAEAEGRVLRVTEVQKKLADARLEVAEARAAAAKGPDGAAAKTALDAARQAAATATAQWNRAELDAAWLDLKRRRLLYLEGVATKRELEMAEERVALLTGTVPP